MMVDRGGFSLGLACALTSGSGRAQVSVIVEVSTTPLCFKRDKLSLIMDGA